MVPVPGLGSPESSHLMDFPVPEVNVNQSEPFPDYPGVPEQSFYTARGGIVDADIRQGVMEAMVARRFISATYSLELYGGIRWWDIDLDLSIDPALLPGTTDPSVSEDWIDVVVGGHILFPLNDHWRLTGHLDLGGLGLEADFTLSTSLGIQYEMTETMVLDLRYKALWVDYESGKPGSPGSFAYDTVTHGPYFGLIFEF